jgi:hypothetical protein
MLASSLIRVLLMPEATVDKAGRVKIFLDDAENFLERGFKEFKEAVRLNDQVRIRDAAEKLWNATINATNALILNHLDVVPASHWERRKLLERLEDERPEIEKLRFRDRYGARERYLHEMTFYDGIIDVEMIEREVEKVKEYISDARQVLRD